MHCVCPCPFLQDENSATVKLIGQWWLCMQVVHCSRSVEVGRISRQNQGSCFSSWVSTREWRTAWLPVMSGCSQPRSFVLSGEEHKSTETNSLIGETYEGAELCDSQEAPVPDVLSLSLQAGGCSLTQACIVHPFSSGQRCLQSPGQNLLNFLEFFFFF